MHFAGPETGWAVSGKGTILATRDGGATWTAQKSGTGQHLYGVDFAGPETGWAVGDRGTILATCDGGATWTAHTWTAQMSGIYYQPASPIWRRIWVESTLDDDVREPMPA